MVRFGPFWLAGLLFLLPALLIIVFLPRRERPSLEDALRQSRVAALLRQRDGVTPREVGRDTGLPLEQVKRELSGFCDLALVEPDAAGRWFRTERGERLLVAGDRS